MSQNDGLFERAALAARARNKWTAELCDVLAQISESGWFLGHASFGQYAEKELEIGARQAYDLARVGRSFEELPKIAEAFRSGEVAWSKVREVTRVASAA